MENMDEIMVRRVFESNLETEFSLINSVLHKFPIISLDTEFPGSVFEPRTPFYMLTNAEKYTSMIRNVNSTKIIQLGLCLSDSQGHLPNFGSDCGYIWEFNFREFDEEVDAKNPTSIQLLKSQGIDFQRNKMEGVDTRHFARLFLTSGLGVSARLIFGRPMPGIGGGFPKVTWVLFHALYDLGYLIKILTNQDLPEDQFQFLVLVFAYFGFSMFDVKEIASPLGLHGGLDKISQILGVPRKGGEAHQAGSDSLLTMQVFLRLRQLYFSGQDGSLVQNFNHRLHGLDKADFSEVQRSLTEIRKRRMYAAMHNRVQFQRHLPRMMPCPPFAVVRGPLVHRKFFRVPLGAMAPIAMH